MDNSEMVKEVTLKFFLCFNGFFHESQAINTDDDGNYVALEAMGWYGMTAFKIAQFSQLFELIAEDEDYQDKREFIDQLITRLSEYQGKVKEGKLQESIIALKEALVMYRENP